MTAFTYLGVNTDPEELCDIAGAIERGDDGWRERVDGLPRYVLTPETLHAEQQVIAARLRAIAEFLNRRRDGVPFGGYEFAAQGAAAWEALKKKQVTFGGRRRRADGRAYRGW